MRDDGGHIHGREDIVHYHLCDHGMRLSVPGALRLFEEIALLQSESFGVGIDDYRTERVAWMISRWDVRFLSMPSFGETVTVRTQPIAYRGVTANREYEIASADGTRHVDGRSQWLFVDTDRMRPTRISPETAELYGMPKSGGALAFDGPEEPGAVDHEAVFRARRGDIDLFGHVNNVRYVQWALETLPEEVTAGRRITRLLAHYRGETKVGAEVTAAAQVEEADGGLRARHRVVEGDRPACLLETRWSPIT